MTNGNVDGVRAEALDRMDRAERNYKLAFLAAAFVEAGFLAGYLLLADFGNRLHVLILIAAVAIYSIVGVGLVALGAHINRNTLRIIKAVEAAGRSR